MARGTVKWFNTDKGYGSITQEEGGPDLSARYSSISGTGHRQPVEGETVMFEIGQGHKGSQAENIVRGRKYYWKY